jgi:phosphoribosyl-AMP cyclohydrolase / phosphoribosyl-ATP pyrophosphohydrolase
MKNDDSGVGFLAALEEIICERIKREHAEGSYVASLVAQGERRVAQKVGEEAVEMLLAAVSGTKAEQIEECADLLFHLLVLLQLKGIRLTDVVAALEQRHDRRRGSTP